MHVLPRLHMRNIALSIRVAHVVVVARHLEDLKVLDLLVLLFVVQPLGGVDSLHLGHDVSKLFVDVSDIILDSCSGGLSLGDDGLLKLLKDVEQLSLELVVVLHVLDGLISAQDQLLVYDLEVAVQTNEHKQDQEHNKGI